MRSKWRRTHYTSEITPELDGKEVALLGWVHDVRDLGGIKFILLRDKEGLLQITLPKDKVPPELFGIVDELRKESVISVKGVVKTMPQAPGGAEVIPKSIELISMSKTPLPLDVTGKVPADLDTRLNARILDLRRFESAAIFKIQHVVLQLIREFLTREGFMEVMTPKILATATEGGAALFPVAYFERTAFLAQSPQLYKEELTAAFEKVFEIAPFFRAEESNTAYHLNEFISVDIEAAFYAAEDVMDVLERMIAYIVNEVKKKCTKELQLLGQELPELKTPFPRITYTEALELLKEHGMAIPWGEDLPTPANRKLGEIFKGPYFITEWPTALKPFYIKPKDDDPKVSESFDLNWSWLELASGGTRIHDKELLVKRLEEQGLKTESFRYHLMVYDYGMPPHAGWGFGFNRFIMILTGRKNIREVVLFPRDRQRLTP